VERGVERGVEREGGGVGEWEGGDVCVNIPIHANRLRFVYVVWGGYRE